MKFIRRRQFLHLAAGAVVLPATARLAWAQAYPTRPITLLHGFAPGGGVDATGRILAESLSRRLGQQVVLESKPGAGTTIAAAELARAPRDGYTLEMFTSTYAAAAALYKQLSFQPVNDFSMIGMITQYPYLLATYADHPARNVMDLINEARSRSTPLLFGTPGVGSAQHLLVELLAQTAKVKFQHVPFRGGAQALTELLGKRIDFMVDPPTILMEYIKSGGVRALAVTTAARSRALPDTPTVAEAGFPGFDVPSWNGLVAPAGIPDAIVKSLNADLAATLAEPSVMGRLRALGSEPSPSTPQGLKDRLASDIAKWTAVIDAAKIERV